MSRDLRWLGKGVLRHKKKGLLNYGDPVPVADLTEDRLAFFVKKGLIGEIKSSQETISENHELQNNLDVLRSEKEDLNKRCEDLEMKNLELESEVSKLQTTIDALTFQAENKKNEIIKKKAGKGKKADQSSNENVVETTEAQPVEVNHEA